MNFSNFRILWQSDNKLQSWQIFNLTPKCRKKPFSAQRVDVPMNSNNILKSIPLGKPHGQWVIIFVARAEFLKVSLKVISGLMCTEILHLSPLKYAAAKSSLTLGRIHTSFYCVWWGANVQSSGVARRGMEMKTNGHGRCGLLYFDNWLSPYWYWVHISLRVKWYVLHSILLKNSVTMQKCSRVQDLSCWTY